MTDVTVSVVVPTYCRPGPLARCLGALLHQRRKPDEIVVALRRDDRETAELLRSRVESLTEAAGVPLSVAAVEARGVLARMDAATDVAAGDVLAFTDDDACPREDWLARLLEWYSDATVGAVGGRDVIHQHGGVVRGSAGAVGLVRWYGRTVGNHHLGTGAARDVDVLKGVNLSVRRSLWGIDRRLRGLGAEPHWELELCLGLARSGWRLIYDPAAIVDHRVAPRMGERQRGDVSLDYVRNSAHNETYALLKWSAGSRRPLALAYALLVGSRAAPGLLAAANRWTYRPDRHRLSRDLAAALAGRRAAVRSYRALRSDDWEMQAVRAPPPRAPRRGLR